MRAALFAFIGLALAPRMPAQEAAAAPSPAAPTTIGAEVRRDSSFAFGFQLGRQFHAQFGPTGLTVGDIDMEPLVEGLRKGLAGSELGKDEEKKLGDSLAQLQEVLKGRMTQLAEKNLRDGQAFLEANRKKPGVKATASGLQYEVLVEGKGPRYDGDGADNPEFRIRYEGRFCDGKKFDGNMEGEPTTVDLARVVAGLREALIAMPGGSKWRLALPAELGYGKRGKGGLIPPNSVLVFDLEMIDFKKGSAQLPTPDAPAPAPSPAPPAGK